MSLVAAAVCPHPPLLVPELAAGAARELDALRSAADLAVHRLVNAGADRLVAVGGGPRTFTADNVESGSWRAYGMPGGTAVPGVPLSLRIAAWLLDRVAVAHPASTLMSVLAVAEDLPVSECAALGAGLAGTADRVALLVMGDGSAYRSGRTPGSGDPRAEAYDRAVADALATGDAYALLNLDPQVSARLKVAGRASWQVLAGAAVAGDGLAGPARDHPAWCGELLYDDAPYEVGYFVAYWEPAGVVRPEAA